jgi:hypothetical protein
MNINGGHTLECIENDMKNADIIIIEIMKNYF